MAIVNGNGSIENKLWGFCHTLRHDGIDYADYIEQLTYLLFLKMADEREVALPKKYNWQSLIEVSENNILDHYSEILTKLRKQPGILGQIFTKAKSEFNNAINLQNLIKMIDEEKWTLMDIDVKGAAFESLLEKAASKGKQGAGQYFTPRVLIQSIVRVMKPDPRVSNDYKICDPACGTGGFLVCAYEWLKEKNRKEPFEKEVEKRIRKNTYYGQDLVPRPRRLALMNMYLHTIEPQIKLGDTIYEPFDGIKFDCILTNPPFGTKGANQVPGRDDFAVDTSNKQLNFVQHIVTALKDGGRAAIVLPDNCLFEDKAGEVFKLLLKECNLHTILRLPRGTFTPYSQGVKANVIFIQKGLPTNIVWIFDARSNVPGITKKDRPLNPEHFEEFEYCYGSDPNGQIARTEKNSYSDRFRKFTLSEIKERNYNLDITWLKDESLDSFEDLSEPQILAAEAITELETVVDDLKEILVLIETNGENC